MAIDHALWVHSIYELPEDERPDRRLWLDDEALAEWWQVVKERREEKYGTKNRDEEPDLVQNQATAHLRRK